MMNFRTYKKETEKRRARQMILTELNAAVNSLIKRRDEYAERAKESLKKGNRSQYNAYVALLKNTVFHLSQTQDMLANYTIACDLYKTQNLSRKFVNAVDSVMKDVYKTSKSICVNKSQKLFTKALEKQNYTSVQLQELLKSNNISFASSVNALSDIGDEEIRSILETEIKKDDKDVDEMLSRLESEFAVSLPQAKIAEIQGGEEPPSDRPEPLSEQNPPSLPQESDGSKEQPANTENGSDGEGGIHEDLEESHGNETLKTEKFEVTGAAFRPRRLKDYIGQANAVATLSDPIKTAMLRENALPHVLLCGSYGQGKTTLAKIIANEMGGNFIEVTSSVKSREMIRILRSLKKGDIVFIDEVHQVSTEIIESVLYPAMEDFELHLTESNSTRTRSKTEKIQPFTLIGATTETGKLLKPFYSKFPINVTLAEYKVETIAAIVKNSFGVNGIRIEDNLCFEIAKRSRLSPRMANAFVVGIGDSAIVRAAECRNITARGALNDRASVVGLNIEITPSDIEQYFDKLGIDKLGLKEEERKILRFLIENYNGGPVGMENIAKGINMAVNRVDQEYEPYLVKLGFLGICPQGRFVTDSGYEYMGMQKKGKKAFNGANKKGGEIGDRSDGGMPRQAGDGGEKSAGEGEEKQALQDDLPVIECKIGEFDKSAAERFAALFSGEATIKESTLDELFPDVDKTYDSVAMNRSMLKAGQREIYCDSKLERRFIAYLFKTGCITDAKAEALELEYSSGHMSGKRYFPDFAVKLYDGTVAIIEMKNLSSVGYHLNIDKYAALEKFCLENGYRYAEIAKDYETNRYISAEQIKSRGVNEELKKYIYNRIAENGICPATDLNEFKYDIKDLVCLLLNDRNLKNIDRTGNNPQIINADE